MRAPFNGCAFAIFFARGHQARHFGFGDFDLGAAVIGEVDVFNNVILSSHGGAIPYFRLRFGGAYSNGEGPRQETYKDFFMSFLTVCRGCVTNLAIFCPQFRLIMGAGGEKTFGQEMESSSMTHFFKTKPPKSAVILALFGLALPAGISSAVAGEDPRIGEEVKRICFARNIDNFKSIDGDDQAILLEEGVNDWYRVELSGACRGSTIRHAQSIALDPRAGSCLRRNDVLILSDSVFGSNDAFRNRRCFIGKINVWNEDAELEAEEDAGDEKEDEDKDKDA